MLLIAVLSAIFLKYSDLPLWVSIPIVILCVAIDRLHSNQQEKIAHLRFMTIEKGLVNIIIRMTEKKE